MSRRCELTGVGVQYGNKVSHSNRKSSRRFLPNLQHVSLESEALGMAISLRVTAATLRSVEHNGGLDAFLLSHNENTLTEKGVDLRKKVRKALEVKAA